MNKNEFIKDYLKQRGKRVLDEATKRYKHDVYDAMSEAEIQQRVDALDIQDLDETVDTANAVADDGSQVADPNDKSVSKDDDVDGKVPQDLGDGVTLISVDKSNEYKG